MSNQKKAPLDTKLKALGYFRNSETNVNVVEDQVFKASKRYAQGLLEAGLVEEANHNAKVGLGNPELKLKRIKEAKKLDDEKKEKAASIRNEKILKEQKRLQEVVDKNKEIISAEIEKNPSKNSGILEKLGFKKSS